MSKVIVGILGKGSEVAVVVTTCGMRPPESVAWRVVVGKARDRVITLCGWFACLGDLARLLCEERCVDAESVTAVVADLLSMPRR
jgi:hypothetical protein